VGAERRTGRGAGHSGARRGRRAEEVPVADVREGWTERGAATEAKNGARDAGRKGGHADGLTRGLGLPRGIILY
jgi:hypothetical protein